MWQYGVEIRGSIGTDRHVEVRRRTANRDSSPGSGRPCESMIAPRSSPISDCADALPAHTSASHVAASLVAPFSSLIHILYGNWVVAQTVRWRGSDLPLCHIRCQERCENYGCHVWSASHAG